MSSPIDSSRRGFLKSASAFAFPAIVPSTVFGQSAPSNRINVAQLGCGRIARAMDFPGILKHTSECRVVAVCDLDTVRLADGKALVENHYAKALGSASAVNVKTYTDYHEMLADKSIDAVAISTPDHWHAQPAIEAAFAGKDVWLQKPASLTIKEGRQMADALKSSERILQIGSQQRSESKFRLACELVRSGRIGKLQEIHIGLPVDPAGGSTVSTPVPSNIDYDKWLGSTPMVPYIEDRVHPQSDNISKRYERPGWLRCEQFGAGMITGWGAHHFDIAHWAMDTEYSGPVEVEAMAMFPTKGLWDVHGSYHVKARYANGVTVYASDKYANGLRFVGEEGWIWVTRGNYDAAELISTGRRSTVLDASDLRIILTPLKDADVHLHVSPKGDHHLDWLTAIKTRKPAVTNAEIGHRSCSACLVSHAAMRLGRTLKWDPAAERFRDDQEANSMLARPQRGSYGTDALLAKTKLSSSR